MAGTATIIRGGRLLDTAARAAPPIDLLVVDGAIAEIGAPGMAAPSGAGNHALLLTDTAVRAARARGKEYKSGDGGGLYLLVTPSGGRLWRVKYRMHGSERKRSVGRYPDVSLNEDLDRDRLTQWRSRREKERARASGVRRSRDLRKRTLLAYDHSPEDIGEMAGTRA